MNLLLNFVLNKFVIFHDKSPPWMIDHIRNKINWKNQIYKL